MKNSGDNLDVGGVNMKMNKITQFLKRNVFYISMGVVIVGALVAVLLLPSGGNVQPDTNIPNKQVAGKVSEDYEGEKIIVNDEMPTEEEMTSGDETDISEEKSLEPEDIQEQAQVEEQATTEEETEVAPTPEATTVPETEDEALNIEAAVSDESVSLFVNPVEENTPVVIDFTGDRLIEKLKEIKVRQFLNITMVFAIMLTVVVRFMQLQMVQLKLSKKIVMILETCTKTLIVQFQI